MSDIILKFWPKEDVTENKIFVIKSELTKIGFIGSETEFWNQPSFRPGPNFNTFFEPLLERGNEYFESLSVIISEKDYGVLETEEDFDFINRLNVVSILGGDGTFENWATLINSLKEITGDEYQGGYELL